MRCNVRLAASQDGRSFMALKLMLLGMKLRAAGELVRLFGGGRRAD
jgi:hypothetical protein